MKKKLFLFITCFFLFSSLTIFLTHRNIQLSEITKNKEEEEKKLEEEVKRLLKELKKSNLNQKEDCREEIDDLPWTLNWKGAILPLVVSALIAVFVGRCSCFDGCTDTSKVIIDIVAFVILFFGLFPLLLAIAKYKDKSYKERYRLLWRNYWKPFVCFVLSVFFVVLLIGPYDNIFKKNQ